MAYATKEGTFGYLKQFSGYSRDAFRFTGEYFVSSLGLGTFKPEPYREDNYIINYKEAIISAVRSGINFIDTAINYRFQISEREVNEALTELFASGEATREQLVIASKAGFLPMDFPFPENPYDWIDNEIVGKGLASKEEIVVDQHCMSPAFLRWSVEQSLKNIGIETLDILYLHNPETQLGYVDYETLKGRIKEAFALFETLVEEGKIRDYGVACWNGFLYEEGHTEYLSLKDLVEIAMEVGGEKHHFKYVQSPFNLAKPHAYNYTNQKGPDGRYYSLIQMCQGYGLNYVASSPLLQMNLFKKSFSPDVKTALGCEELGDIHAALQFARSCGAVSAVFGAVESEHVKQDVMLSYAPNATPQGIAALFGQGERDAV